MTPRHRIGVVCGTLIQGGGGRYAYELCRAIDQSRFDVDVLTIAPWGVKRHFYADAIRRLGIGVREILPLFHFRRTPRVVRHLPLAAQRTYRRVLLPRLLAKYDLIATLSLDYFLDVQPMLPHGKRQVVHLLNHLHQYPYNRFLDWPPKLAAHFVCMDRFQERDLIDNLRPLVESSVVAPLPIDSSQLVPIKDWPHSHRPVIASFMRIERDRHPLPLLRSFGLIAEAIDAEMYFYGTGDASEIAALKAEAAKLRVLDRVQFRGHSADIRRSVIEDRVSFAWLTACNDCLGYSGIELALLAVPTLYYNIEPTESAEVILQRTGGAMQNYSTEKELAEATAAAWKKADRGRSIGRKLRAFVRLRHDSQSAVRQIEAFYEGAIEGATAKNGAAASGGYI